MKNINLAAVLVLALASRSALPHGDHSVPGATPPGLHGGFVKEASDSHGAEKDSDHEADHDHDHGTGKEEEHKEEEPGLFLEALFDAKTKKLSVYPLGLSTPTSALFTELKPSELILSGMKIQFPRLKKTIAAQPTVTEKAFEVEVDPGSAVRFIVHISVQYNGEEKSAQIQVETER